MDSSGRSFRAPRSARSRCSSPARRSLWALLVAWRCFVPARPSLPGISGALDSFRQFQRRLRLLSRSAFAGHAAGGHRRGIPHPHLFRRLHVGRSELLPLLRLPESVHVFHADAGAGQQLPGDVHRVGGRGAGVVSADRVLVHERFGGVGRKESVHRQPHRRLRISDCPVPDHPAFRLADVHPGVRAGGADRAGKRRRGIAYRDRNSADGGRLRQVGADSALRLAAGCDGRPDAGLAL